MTAGLGYDVHGPDDAPVVVLGSSLGTDRHMWDPQVEALARRYRVVRYDHRGHGASETPTGPYSLAELGGDVVALLDTLGVDRFHAAGLSLGGMVAMWLAAHVPARVESLSLFCTSAHMPPPDGWLERAETARTQGPAVLAEGVVGRWFTPAFAGSDAAAAVRATLAGTDGEGYAGCCEAIAAMDLRPVLGRVQAPTLVVAGRDDPATPADPHARTIVDGLGAPARLELVDGAHLATVENPDVCTALLIEHLDTVTGGLDR